MNKNITKYLKILFLVLLAALFLGLESKNRLYLTYLIVIGILGAVLFLLLPQLKSLFRLLQRKLRRVSRVRKNTNEQSKPKSDITLALLCQFSHRITAKLKSAYPDATWDWETKPNVKRLLDGNIARIRTANTGDYNFAEMHVDHYGNIILQMMLIQTLDQKPVPSEGEPEPPVIVDCSSWFSLLGEKILVDVIGDLNCHGHSCLHIDDAGSILIKNEKEEMNCKAQLPHFPGKKHYQELISIFTDAELKAAIENETIKLSW